ncbi:hypothetical protein BFX12_13390 [Vibrio cholerae]|nr:hypothetical protein A5A_023473 [Vibrio cholerae MZO-2]MEB5541135.1 hypothetical protein [Vibrio cholerae]MEB5550319.1 hypothetical protein [Vibrio cholerae]OEC22588.1 hypothetical protein BFX12_13390 [Vibrio cholerae]
MIGARDCSVTRVNPGAKQGKVDKKLALSLPLTATQYFQRTIFNEPFSSNLRWPHIECYRRKKEQGKQHGKVTVSIKGGWP